MTMVTLSHERRSTGGSRMSSAEVVYTKVFPVTKINDLKG